MEMSCRGSCTAWKYPECITHICPNISGLLLAVTSRSDGGRQGPAEFWELRVVWRVSTAPHSLLAEHHRGTHAAQIFLRQMIYKNTSHCAHKGKYVCSCLWETANYFGVLVWMFSQCVDIFVVNVIVILTQIAVHALEKPLDWTDFLTSVQQNIQNCVWAIKVVLKSSGLDLWWFP